MLGLLNTMEALLAEEYRSKHYIYIDNHEIYNNNRRDIPQRSSQAAELRSPLLRAIVQQGH